MGLKLKKIDHPQLEVDEYLPQLEALQTRLMEFQLGLYETGRRAVIVLEGTDASGKGGLIRRMVDKMDSRGYRVHPVGPPTADELERHYLQRFWRRIPRAGQLVVFDRSWYGRVLIERVEGLIEVPVWQRAYEEIRHFEKLLVEDGHILIKLFLHIDADEQLQRFRKRLNSPDKSWKLTMADLESREYWAEYQQAYQDMFDHTHRDIAPWNLIGANCKKHARITGLAAIADELQRHIDLDNIEFLSPAVARRARALFKD